MTLPTLRDPDAPNTWRLACHESGHAVAGIALGREFQYVTLVPTTRWAGAVVGVRPLHRPLGGIVTSIAGPLAEAIHAGTNYADAVCRGGRIDTRNVFDRGDGLGADAYKALIRRALRIVTVTHADSILAVARALLRPPQRLTRAQVAALVEDNQENGLSWLIRRHEAALAEQTEQTHHEHGLTTTNSDPWSSATTQTVKPR